MKGKRTSFGAALAVLAAVALTACSASAPASPAPASVAPASPAPASPPPAASPAAGAASYYVALGGSLAQGVQPDASGRGVETAQGYANVVYSRLRASHPTLRLVRLGCPGETTVTMMHGGMCGYAAGSQLAAATAFLRAHRGHVSLVTLDIGANDAKGCGGQPSQAEIAVCTGQLPAIVANVSTILAMLRAAAGPGVRIVGLNYYLPALAEWRNGTLGQSTARAAETFIASFNALLAHAYAQAGDSVADVSGAFDTSDFGDPVTVPGLGSLPRNVARICQWTWECAPPPRGPNEHPNAAGYRVIANAILKVPGISGA